MSKQPGTPRIPSWRAAVAPSRLIDMASTPAAFNSPTTSAVSRVVALGATETPSPSPAASRTSAPRSGRLRGSPPVKITCGGGAIAVARSRSTSRHSSVVSSSTPRSGCASARQ